jgi:hypothetical protein
MAALWTGASVAPNLMLAVSAGDQWHVWASQTVAVAMQHNIIGYGLLWENDEWIPLTD